jgi:NADH:ubiquinone oxidoreductase subunit E
VLERLIDVLGVKVGETTPDGLFTLETSSCLGICGVAPAMMIDEETYGNLTPDRIVEIIERIRREENER